MPEGLEPAGGGEGGPDDAAVGDGKISSGVGARTGLSVDGATLPGVGPGVNVGTNVGVWETAPGTTHKKVAIRLKRILLNFSGVEEK